MASLAQSLDFLARTPAALATLLDGLDERWLRENEGPGTYTTLDVLGHLIHGEDADWLPRTRHILAHGDTTPFEAFDREGMRGKYDRLTSRELLALFAEKRAASLAAFRALGLDEKDLARRGRHPALGPVTLGQLVHTWVVHDLSHIAQIARVLAKARAPQIGAWAEYFNVLKDRTPKA
jgi:hypothetical protein